MMCCWIKWFFLINDKMKTINKIAIVMSLAILGVSCSDDECGYESEILEPPCEEFCELLTDFESEEIGPAVNWQSINANNVEIISRNASQVLQAIDASGGSVVYNDIDFPSDFIAAGCELHYDVEYMAGSSNSATSDNSIGIYQGGNLVIGSPRAFFVLNPASLLQSGAAPVTIRVPLELASGRSLPSNSMGEWVLAGATGPPTAADIATFNSLIQNAVGLGFGLDEGSNPSERWYWDNFCFVQCCIN